MKEQFNEVSAHGNLTYLLLDTVAALLELNQVVLGALGGSWYMPSSNITNGSEGRILPKLSVGMI